MNLREIKSYQYDADVERLKLDKKSIYRRGKNFISGGAVKRFYPILSAVRTAILSSFTLPIGLFYLVPGFGVNAAVLKLWLTPYTVPEAFFATTL